jgi:hypothetical protein
MNAASVRRGAYGPAVATQPAPGSWLIAAALIVGLSLGVYLGLIAKTGQRVLFVARFGRSGLVTNEYAYHNPGSGLAVRSSQWEATSGSLFAVDGSGWTGLPDGVAPDPASHSATDSAVFRLRTRRRDFADVAVTFRLRLARFIATPRTPAQAYDGVHVWLRYQNPDWLYFASVARRDGRIVIGKKLATASGGVYSDIVSVRGHPLPRKRWESVRVMIQSHGGAAVIEVFVSGRLLARAIDNGKRSPAIRRAGHVGIRGDNAEFEFRDFTVSTA